MLAPFKFKCYYLVICVWNTFYWFYAQLWSTIFEMYIKRPIIYQLPHSLGLHGGLIKLKKRWHLFFSVNYYCNFSSTFLCIPNYPVFFFLCLFQLFCVYNVIALWCRQCTKKNANHSRICNSCYKMLRISCN